MRAARARPSTPGQAGFGRLYRPSPATLEEAEMAAESSASTVWEGDLGHGLGTTTPASGAFPAGDVSWAAGTGRAAGKTSPEELLAAAHSSCYCMALSHELGEAGTPPDRLEATATGQVGAGEAGTPPDRLEATATVQFVPGEGVTSSHIVVSGSVPGVDQAAFAAAAAAA